MENKDRTVLEREISKRSSGLKKEKDDFLKRVVLQATEMAVERARREGRRSRYIRIARKGYMAITTFARTRTMRRFFRINTGGSFVFFDHPSKVRFRLYGDRMEIYFPNGGPVYPETFEFPYKEPEKFDGWIRGEEMMFTLDSWFYDYEEDSGSDEICSATRFWSESSNRRIRSEYDNLDSRSLALSTLVDCADLTKFNKILEESLKDNG